MLTFIERYVLALFVGAAITVGLTNIFKLDWPERISAVLILSTVAFLFAYEHDKLKQKKSNPSQASVQQAPQPTVPNPSANPSSPAPTRHKPHPAPAVHEPQEPARVVPPATQPSEGNKTLSKGDRDRLTDAFFEFSQILDEANTAWGKANRIKVDESGPLLKDLEKRRSKIPEIESSAKEFEKHFYESRQKWKYYDVQISSIFGVDPDNHALILRNAVDEYATHLDSLLAIKNIDELNLRKLLWVEDIRYDEAIQRFALWKQECERRLEQAKSSLR
jgi:hypothetical protein